MIGTTRRVFGILAAAAVVSRSSFGQTQKEAIVARTIPSSGEGVPAVGLGTAYVFDTDNEQTRAAAAQVIQTLVQSGGRLVDTASTYGDAEIVIGNATTNANLRDKLFLATKLEAPNAAELKRSLTTQNKTGRLTSIPQCKQTTAILGTIQGLEGARHMPLYRHHLHFSG